VIAAIAAMIGKLRSMSEASLTIIQLGIGNWETGGQSKTDQSLELLIGRGSSLRLLHFMDESPVMPYPFFSKPDHGMRPSLLAAA
jgi:hypothetical protein